MFYKKIFSKFRPVIKENTACVVVTRQKNVLVLWRAILLWRVISVKLNIGNKITRLEIMTLNRKKMSMFPNLFNSCLRLSYTVYRHILESRQVGRAFKLPNLKQDRVPVHNDSLSLNLSAWSKYVNRVSAYF